jgi:hypothetical protein
LEVIMIRNMGTADRSIRVVLGVAAVLVSVFFAWGSLVGTIVGVALLVFAGIMLVTAAVGFCPTYRLLHISTYPTLHRTAETPSRAAESGTRVPAHH